MNISDIYASFGAFLAVLMAMARKVIAFDFNMLTTLYIFTTASVVLALGITYWLIAKKIN